MKKMFWLMAAPVMVSLMAVSCKEDNNDPDNGPDGPNTGDETELTIDGKFSDWDALPASDVVSVTLPADADKKAVRALKFYDTKEFLYVYAEVDPASVGTSYIEAEKWDSGKGQPRPFRLVIDTDNNAATGGTMLLEFPDGEWGGDILIDSYIYADAGKVKLGWSELWDYDVNKVAAGESGNGLNMVDHITQNTTLDSKVVTPMNLAGSLVKGYYAFEYAIDKSLIGDYASTVKVGAFLLDDGWGEPGLLPAEGKPIVLNLK